MSGDTQNQRWAARPVYAGLIRAVVFLLPIAGSVVFLHFAGRLIAVPTSSFVLFVGWWVVMSGSATLVLVAIDRVARRLLPLAALYKLSLVFPDNAPSRFKAALRSNTTETLEQRVAKAKALNDRSTPIEAAQRLLALAAELDSHDRLTRGHSERVRAYSQLIAKELRLSDEERDLLNWAALLHDVGKLSVPSSILTKPGRPTDAEWRVLRRHPELGMELVAPLQAWLGEWAKAVGDHHERWDGKGYPNGLEGESIALAGRIVAVADVFDVITSARSYKSAFASTAGREEIARCAGTQFDPRVVRAFLNVSLGRLRFVMGPLSWLAHAPLLGRLPLSPALGTAAASVATVAAAVTTGVVATPPSTGQAGPPPKAGVEQPVSDVDFARRVQEDESLTIGLEGVRDGARVTSLDIWAEPEVGRAGIARGRKILYTPPPDFHGRVSIGYDACWAGRGCRSGTITVTVAPVNDVPVARDDRARTRAGSPVTIDVLANDSDPDGDVLSVRSLAEREGRGSARRVGDRVRWTPARGFTGRATFEYVASDGNGGTALATVTVQVSKGAARPPDGSGEEPLPEVPVDEPAPEEPPPVPARGNRAPEASPDRVSVPEHGSIVVDVLANDSDPDGDRLSLASVGAPERGSARLSGDRIQFSAPSNFVGTVTFPYVVSDPDGLTDQAQVSVNVLLVNAAPSFTAGPDQRVLEDAGAQRVARWARAISPGPSSESGQEVSFLVSSDNAELFAEAPEIRPDGTLTYTPARDAFGVSTVRVRARDDGGTANGGRDTSPAQELTITVRPVNDAPSFTPGADQSAAEDAGEQTVRGWATAIEVGPQNEARQGLEFVVTNGRRTLFTSGGQPEVSPDGTLRYTPAPDATGSATVSVHAKDDGGIADGGEDTSRTFTFTIAIRPVNDPPSFRAGGNQTVAEDSGPQTVPGWATGISPGPADESSQSVSFVVSNDNNALFASQPAVAPNGTLTFTPAANANGSATVTVRARDDGGGSDTSDPQTFTITVTPVNDPPVANADAATVAEDDASGVTFDVLGNDTDVDAGDTLSVFSYDASSVANGTLTHNGGGSFTYVPDPGFTGTETFTYVVKDSAGSPATASVTITVTNVPSAPVAGADAYLTPQDTTLSETAPGLLANDSDYDGDPLTVQTTPVSAPANGSVTLAADGSFTYVPNAGFTGTDSFTYRVDDGTGLTDDGMVTITVSTTASPSTLYLQPSGPSADVWSMLPALPPAVSPVPDHDGDGSPGLTITESNGNETNSDPAEWHDWVYPASAPLDLNGPVTLQLWSSVHLFTLNKDVHPYVYLYDCASGGTGCVKLAENDAHVNNWNGLLAGWVYHQITVGSVTTTIAPSRELRVKLLIKHEDIWVALTSAYPSALAITLA